MRDFRKLEIWQEGINLVKKIYKLTAQLPKEEIYGLRSQMTRAAVSVPSNIAEGCSRNSQVEFKRFLEIAIGSLFELETQVILVQELNLISQYNFTELFEIIKKEEKKLNSLITKIARSQQQKANSKKPLK